MNRQKDSTRISKCHHREMATKHVKPVTVQRCRRKGLYMNLRKRKV